MVVISFVVGEINIDVDVGLYQLFIDLGDIVFYDENGNGIQDVGELGVLNVIVNFYNEVGVLVGMIIMDVNGFYQFIDLIFGNYQVQFVLLVIYFFII